MSPSDFNPTKDIPDLSGKVIFITGGNSGIGAETVRALTVHNPAHIYLCARKTTSGDALVTSIKQSVPNAQITVLALDLASFESIKQCVARFNELSPRLDILMLNAGVAGLSPQLTKEGYEIHFGTNYLGHALLTQLLLPKIIETKRNDPSADVRIHVTSSQAGNLFAPGGGIATSYMRQPSPGSGGTQRYGHSKLATLLMMKKLAQEYPDIHITASHPGTVKTETWGKVDGSKMLTMLQPVAKLTGVTAAEGAKNQLWCCTAKRGPQGVEHGKYYLPVGKECDLSRKNSGNQAQADQLWHWTNDEFKKYDAPGWPKTG